MSNENALLKFLEAENSRDWDQYMRYLHPSVEWTLFAISGSQSMQGIENYMERIISAYEDNNDSFVCEQRYSSQSGTRIVTVLCNNHGQRSIDVFDFEDGLIRAEYEFLLNE